MVAAAERLRAAGIDVPDVSIGSTPAMTAVQSLEGVTEARPGNYAFYDLTQVALRACEPTDCVLSVLTSVVSSPAGGDHSVIDAGALALSKDRGPTHLGHTGFGGVYQDYERAELSSTFEVSGVSQEHGRVSGRLPVGTRLRIAPNHSCLTAAQFDHYRVVRGDQVVDLWPVLRGR